MRGRYAGPEGQNLRNPGDTTPLRVAGVAQEGENAVMAVLGHVVEPAREVQPSEAPKAAERLAKLAAEHGWTFSLTHAVGVLHAELTKDGTPYADSRGSDRGIVSTALRLRRGRQRAHGIWWNDKWSSGMLLTVGHSISTLGATALKALIKGEPV